MANTTRDLRVTLSLANMYMPQQDGKNIAGRVYYIGQLVIKDGNGRLDNPGATTDRVLGVFKGSQYDATAYAALAVDAEEFTVQTGEYFHFVNSTADPILATTKPGTAIYAEDNQTFGLNAATGSPGAKFLGWDQGRLKIGVGPQYW